MQRNITTDTFNGTYKHLILMKSYMRVWNYKLTVSIVGNNCEHDFTCSQRPFVVLLLLLDLISAMKWRKQIICISFADFSCWFYCFTVARPPRNTVRSYYIRMHGNGNSTKRQTILLSLKRHGSGETRDICISLHVAIQYYL